MEETQSEGRLLTGSGMATDGMNGLRHSGFARYGPPQLGIDPAGAAADDLAKITEGCTDLPPDPYAPGTNRYRRYSHAVYLPWKDELSWIPGTPDPVHGTVTESYQDEHDPSRPRLRRALPDIPEPLRTNPLLERLVRWDIGQTLWLEGLGTRPMWAGVHLIKLGVESPGQVAVSLPNCLHQDGGSRRTFTFAHLISYRNITGGENVIATHDSAGLLPEDVHEMDIHARFTLRDPLDGYAVHDHRVSHYVGPVLLGDQPEPGERCILIVGLAPYVPQL